MWKSLARAFSDCVSANHALTLFPKFNKILFYILMPISLQEHYPKNDYNKYRTSPLKGTCACSHVSNLESFYFLLFP